jgi:hypothetical protein
VQASTNITVAGVTFDQVSGNALMFSNAVNQSTVVGCTFFRVGESAIAMLGSTRLMDGTPGQGLYPEGNLIESNLVDTVGVYGKQTSAYFKGKSAANTVRGNVFMNGQIWCFLLPFSFPPYHIAIWLIIHAPIWES